MTEYKKNLLSGLVFLLIGVIVLIAAPIYINDPQVSAVGPRAFPQFIGWAMIIISTILISQSALKQHRAGLPLIEKKDKKTLTEEERAARKTAVRNELRAFAALAIMLAYALLFDKIGYFASTFLAVTAYLVLLRVKSIWSYVISYAVAVALWAAFTYLLAVRLP